MVSDTDEAYADIVRFGHKAVKLEYDWTNINGTDGACLGLGDNLAIDGTPTALGVWVYIPEGVPVPCSGPRLPPVLMAAAAGPTPISTSAAAAAPPARD